MKKCVLTGALLAGLAAQAESVMPTAMLREDIIVPMALLDVENGNKIVGEVRISYNSYGALFHAEIEGLPQGIYGFHVHENPSCEAAEKDGKMVAGLAAGGDNYSDHPAPLGGGGARKYCGVIAEPTDKS